MIYLPKRLFFVIKQHPQKTIVLIAAQAGFSAKNIKKA
jgi:hypothetical protein